MPNKSVSQDDATTQPKNANIPDKKSFIRNLLFDDAASDESTTNANIKQTLAIIHQQSSALLNAESDGHAITLKNYLLPALRERLDNVPTTVNNLITLVDQIFDALIERSALSPQLGMTVNKLRLPFCLMILMNPKLLLKKDLTAKQFLNDIIAVGLLWDPNDSKTDQIRVQINTSVDHLLNLTNKPDDLERQLIDTANQFSQFSESVIRRVEIFEKRIREAEEGQAKAQTAQRWAEKTLQKILAKDAIPEFIKNMLQEAWRHVIFLEYLKTGDKAHNSNLFTAKALLASIQPFTTFEETEKFLDLQPKLIEKLKSGLEKTTYSFTETSAFLEELDTLHDKLLENAKIALEKTPKEEILRLKPASGPFELESPEPQEVAQQFDIESMDVNQWIEHVFNKIPESQSAVDSESKVNDGRREKDRRASEKLIKLLKPGRWISLNQNDQPARCKLSTYIESSDKYIFVSGAGNKVAEFDSAALIAAYQEKAVTLLENPPLFERAFKSVLNQLFDQHQENFAEQQKQKAIKQPELQQSTSPAQDSADLPQVETEKTTQDTKEKAPNKTAEKPSPVNRDKTPEFSAEDLENLSRLAVGSWVEVKVGYKMKKCRLAARIASTGKLIFTDRSGIKVKECMDTELADLYHKGELKLDEDHTLFDKAFSSVISNMRNLKSEKI